MTEPEQPDTPPLTRKQLRDLRNTGATPVVGSESAPEAPTGEEPAAESPFAPPPVVTAPPLPRAATPAVISEAPVPDLAVDLGVSPLTRRQARQQERIRTASVPVITPDVIAAHTAASVPAVVPAPVASPDPVDEPTEAPSGGNDDTATSALRGLFADDEPEDDPYSEVAVVVVDEPSFEPVSEEEDEAEQDAAGALFTKTDEPAAEPEPAERPVVNPAFGSALFADGAAQVDLPPSFDDLLARGSTGSVGTSSALILSPPTGESPIIAPVTATGEVLVTGTFNLPEGLGSLGHAPGTADGHEADAVLVDGELPAHSSPTPIAASAAISTVKVDGDVIRPPAPEKGSRLQMWLAITAGVLGLALVGVLVLALTNGTL
ncbi:hypothetical protein GCM10009775_01830 [Microbacterium aoyamense]|uniref:Uncharacterized protein n=1 Tax=Microbacterium aoyamense TaxID=344166 RepID=A0ABN2P6A2_9MICO|nr:hypothetical protein [Microbacterium aoyamense]